MIGVQSGSCKRGKGSYRAADMRIIQCTGGRERDSRSHKCSWGVSKIIISGDTADRLGLGSRGR